MSSLVTRIGPWLGTRVLLVVAVLGVAVAAGVPAETHPWRDGRWWLDRFSFFDSFHFVRVAVEGYFTRERACCDQAYFPAYPLLMRGLGGVLGGPTLAGWLIALVAGVVAAGAFSHIATARLGDLAGRRASWLLALAPAGVFTVTVYSEALFLAAALVAWWAGTRGRWWLAGLASALAVATRVTGVFLVLGLLVMYAVSLASQRRRPGSEVLWPLLPGGALAAWVGWLRAQTGSWDAYRQAQAIGWGREPLAPWDALVHQVRHITATSDGWLQITRSLDLLAVVGGVVLAAVLLWRRSWAEAAYVSASVGAIATGSVWESSMRYALAWFPAYLLLAEVSVRRRWVWWLSVAVSVVLAALMVWAWATRRWIA